MKHTKQLASKTLDNNLQCKALFLQIQENMNAEYQAHYHYLGIANYFYDLDYDGLGQYYLGQSDDEREHSNKYRVFLFSLDYLPKYGAIKAANSSFKSPLQALETALAYEIEITDKTHSLLNE